MKTSPLTGFSLRSPGNLKDSVDSDPDENFGSFYDITVYKISLYHRRTDGKISAILLDEEYMPVKNIKPNAPVSLTVNRMSNHYCIAWMSSYEKYLPFNPLSDNLKYELWFHKNGLDGQSLEVRYSTNLSVGEENLKPQTNYSIKLRSIPNQLPYQGQWSKWTSEVHWRTDAMQQVTLVPAATVLPKNGKFSAIFCLLIPVLLIICYIPIVRLNKTAFIPTPAEYFKPLYSDCKGDFKSWVVTPGYQAGLLKTEETLLIDTLIETGTVLGGDNSSQVPDQMFQDNGNDLFNLKSDVLGLPYAISLGPPLRAPRGPVNSFTLSEQESIIEADSGCWLHSSGSLEQESGWYRNEFNNRDYCTLSDTLGNSKISQTAKGVWCSGSLFSEVMSEGEDQVEC
ncbi:interleukin-9 receptor isoform X2 [Esox lucius]|uniref:interleukin-9 receptor isoform X2 n=1 Tax=Esox lucius TaxID=8010 RepID=UPI00057626B4|nr:interleukin-9 receptor isoform X2 [Esox lucius]